MDNQQSTEQYNIRISKWVGSTSSKLKRSIRSLSMKGKGELARTLRAKTKKDFGEIESIVYSFNRYGVFVHKGVGRGYMMVNGRVVKGHKLGNKVLQKKPEKVTGRTSALSQFSKGGSWYQLASRYHPPREPKEWFNPILDREVPVLADLVAEIKADMTVNAVRMRIK